MPFFRQNAGIGGYGFRVSQPFSKGFEKADFCHIWLMDITERQLLHILAQLPVASEWPAQRFVVDLPDSRALLGVNKTAPSATKQLEFKKNEKDEWVLSIPFPEDESLSG